MGKILNYTIIILGILGLAKLCMIELPSTSLFTSLGLNTSDPLTSGGIWVTAMAILGGLSLGTQIIASFFGRSIPESVARGITVGALALATIPDLLGLISYAGTVEAWVGTLCGLVILPLIGGYLVAMIQYYGGQDI